MNFDVLDLILILGVGQGVFLAVLFQLVKNKNKATNNILSIILLSASAMLVGRIFFLKSSGLFFFKASLITDMFIYLFGPLLYCYYRRLTFIEKPSFKLSFIHFIPVLIFQGYLVWILSYSYEKYIVLYTSGDLYWVFLSIGLTGLTSCFYYGYRCYQTIVRYQKAMKNNSAHPQKATYFLMVFLSTLFI